MALRVHEFAVEQGPDLIDRVGELQPPVLDMDSGVGVPDEPAVHIGDAPH